MTSPGRRRPLAVDAARVMMSAASSTLRAFMIGSEVTGRSTVRPLLIRHHEPRRKAILPGWSLLGRRLRARDTIAPGPGRLDPLPPSLGDWGRDDEISESRPNSRLRGDPLLELGGCTAAGLLGMSLEPAGARARRRPAGARPSASRSVPCRSSTRGSSGCSTSSRSGVAVNTIYLTTFTYGRGLAGRQIPGQPFPDHGVQESDEAFFHGGNYARPHPKFYRDTVLKETRAPDHGDLDIVEAVLPAAKKRGLKVFCSVEDVWRPSVPGFERGGRGRPPGPQGRDALPDEPGRAPLLDRRWSPTSARPTTSTASSSSTSATARCSTPRAPATRSRSPRRARPASASTTGRPRGSTASTSSAPGRGTGSSTRS